MPIYVYLCESCKHTFEELVLSRVNADSVACPRCQAANLKKMPAAFATTSGGSTGEPTCGHGACSRCNFDN